MAERRLPFSVKDDGGVTQRGEIVIARSPSDGIERHPEAAFTIILTEQPVATAPDDPSVVVCSPHSPVKLPASVAESSAAYAGDVTEPVRLSRATADAFADGALIAARPLTVDARDVFGAGVRPKLALLARELISTGAQAEAYWRTIDEVLSWPRESARVVDETKIRRKLASALDGVTNDSAAIERLHAIAGGDGPSDIATSPAELREDVALLRCLGERPDEAADLTRMRDYLAAAAPGAGRGGLLVDHAATREQLSYATLLTEPRQLDRMRATFELYQHIHATTYAEHHARYWRALARLRAMLRDAEPSAHALERLNTIDALGEPVGVGALAAYHELAGAPTACAAAHLDIALRTNATCLECQVTLEDAAPTERVEDVLRRTHGALARQQRRLASEAVRRILARGGERLAQFIQIVQASDLASLAQVLDDDLVTFLRDLLSQPIAPTPEALDIFDQLARAYPTVSEEQIDALVATLRQLLEERIASQRADDPAQPAAFRLASLPPATP